MWGQSWLGCVFFLLGNVCRGKKWRLFVEVPKMLGNINGVPETPTQHFSFRQSHKKPILPSWWDLLWLWGVYPQILLIVRTDGWFESKARYWIRVTRLAFENNGITSMKEHTILLLVCTNTQTPLISAFILFVDYGPSTTNTVYTNWVQNYIL